MLLIPVAWVPGCLGAAMGMQLPPLQHLALHGLTLLLLARRAPTACAQYVGLQPCSGKVVGAAYKVLQSAISLVAPGSNRRLAAAAETASDVQQCTAVAWALQASLGFLLPTLYVWRSQLLVALKYVEGQRHWRRRAEADSALHGSAYAWLCSPVLRAAEFCTGDWTLAVVLAALGGFIAGVLWHHQQNA
ncbi:hypothetical protein COHA_001046 [Chlorella ohadii]|uniref:Uncharacterized protein n=1 Tax=Chlorella ohadii TaxID=2649997 RepID=A0AAD5E2D0_9CHLO|nr:hypothetical protein COHA_001046 [Chlorella ohadii]